MCSKKLDIVAVKDLLAPLYEQKRYRIHKTDTTQQRRPTEPKQSALKKKRPKIEEKRPTIGAKETYSRSKRDLVPLDTGVRRRQSSRRTKLNL